MGSRIVISVEQDTEETRALARALLERLYAVFHDDWDYSQGCLSDEWQRFYIHPQGTFLDPFPAAPDVPQEDEFDMLPGVNAEDSGDGVSIPATLCCCPEGICWLGFR